MSRLHLDLQFYDPLGKRWRSLPKGLRVQVMDEDELTADDELADVETTGEPLQIELKGAGLFDDPDLYFLVHTEGRRVELESWSLVGGAAPGALPLPDGIWDSRVHGDAEVKLDQRGDDLGSAEFPMEVMLSSGVVAASLQVWDRGQGRHIPAPVGIPLEARSRDDEVVGRGAVVKPGLGWVPVWGEERGEVVLAIPASATPLVIDLECKALSSGACRGERLVIARWSSRQVGLGVGAAAPLHPEDPEEARARVREHAFDLSGRPFKHGNTIEPLIDGEETYVSMVQGIRAAKKTAYMVNWDYQPHVCVNRLDDHEPCSIQEVLDEVGADEDKLIRLLPWRYTTPFPAEEKRQKKLDAILADRSASLPGFRGVRQRTAHLLRSHHQKALVVDGDTAWVGGLDFAFGRWATPEHVPFTDWQDNDPLGSDADFGWFPWHDVQCVLTGPAALAVEENFIRRWEASTAEPLPRSRQRAWTGSVPAFVARTWPAEEGGCVAEGVTERTIERLYLEEIQSARSSIYIEQQYLSHTGIGEALAQRVERARAEGDAHFRVVLVLPCRYYEPPVVNGQLAAGQKVCLDRLAAADPEGAHVRVFTVRTWSEGDGTFLPIYVHTKMMIVDERFCTVGSANTNARSMEHDTELNLVFEDRATARRFLTRLVDEHSQGDFGEDHDFVQMADGLMSLATRNAQVLERAEAGLPLDGIEPRRCRVFPHVTENVPIPLPGPDWLF